MRYFSFICGCKPNRCHNILSYFCGNNPNMFLFLSQFVSYHTYGCYLRLDMAICGCHPNMPYSSKRMGMPKPSGAGVGICCTVIPFCRHVSSGIQCFTYATGRGISQSLKKHRITKTYNIFSLCNF